MKLTSTRFRNLAAFWIFGMCNNFAYVIMLSAAEDIIDQQTARSRGRETRSALLNETMGGSCEESITTRQCSSMSTGAVLLADILPSLIIKMLFPFFMHRIPFGFRHTLVVITQAASYLLVGYSNSIAISLIGVIFASACSGLGEITYLSLSSYFHKNTISAWSSGTGGAGVIGSLAYALLTEPKLANLRPDTALLSMLIVPIVFLFAYWPTLNIPPSVHSPRLHPKTWIVPRQSSLVSKNSSSQEDITENESVSPDSSAAPSVSTTDASRHLDFADLERACNEEKKKSKHAQVVPQRDLTFGGRIALIGSLMRYMIPITVVFAGKYLVNQGLVQLIIFNCASGWGLDRKSQYRWYQVLYHIGVFMSRSSVNIVRLPAVVLMALPLFQVVMVGMFFFDALYQFLPHIVVVFLLILVEGLLGGWSYVNTCDRVHKEVSPDVREFALSVAGMTDYGIIIAAFAAIPMHNFICNFPMPS